jgi:aspartate-semialdehyde dehydrogenase
MSHDLPAICLFEPLSLVGRELLQLMEERKLQPQRVVAFHLGADEEHQVAEIGGEPALVPPLESEDQVPEELPIIVAAPPEPARRQVLADLLGQRAEQPVLDIARTGLVEGPLLAGAPPGKLWPPRAVVASPGATVIARLAAPLAELGLEALAAVVEIPASASGRGAVESLARQAAARLQGLPVEEEGGEAAAMAFDIGMVADPAVSGEVARLLRGIESVVSEMRTGTFHGWVVHLSLRFGARVHRDRILGIWESSGTVQQVGEDLRLSGVMESDCIHIGPLRLSEAGRQAVVTAAADGLRLGGAATALEILPALI